MTKNILESFVIIAISVAFAMILTWPKFQEFESQRSLVMGKQSDLETRNEYFKNLQQSSSELSNFGPNLAKIESALPDNPDVATLANYLEMSAMQGGLIIKAADYTADQATAAPAEGDGQKILKNFHIALTLSGPYESWKNFISSVEKSSRMIEIESTQISANPTKIQTGATAASQQATSDILNYVVKVKANSY